MGNSSSVYADPDEWIRQLNEVVRAQATECNIMKLKMGKKFLLFLSEQEVPEKDEIPQEILARLITANEACMNSMENEFFDNLPKVERGYDMSFFTLVAPAIYIFERMLKYETHDQNLLKNYASTVSYQSKPPTKEEINKYIRTLPLLEKDTRVKQTKLRFADDIVEKNEYTQVMNKEIFKSNESARKKRKELREQLQKDIAKGIKYPIEAFTDIDAD